MKVAPVFLGVLGTVAASATAFAVTATQHPSATSTSLELATGTRGRDHRTVTYNRPPRHMTRAWGVFLLEAGTEWQASWDDATGVPSRIFGKGIEVPGAMASAEVAEAWSRDFLARHMDLLAPGASPTDFQLASNVVHAGIRSVGFYQFNDGVRVLGGQVSFRFKSDRMFVIGSEALPHVSAGAPQGMPSLDMHKAAARTWVMSDVAAVTDRGEVDGPFVLPIVNNTRILGYRTVMRVTLQAQKPIGRWDVYVDAATATTVARRQTLMFASGTVKFDVPVRRPNSDRLEAPADFANFIVDGETTASDANGVITWAGAGSNTITIRANSNNAGVENDSGANYTEDVTLADGGEVVISYPDDQIIGSQINGVIHTNKVMQYCKGITPDMGFLDEQIRVTMNINDNCNAFSDGTNINFFTRGGGCENTGLLADVVYHEFGHSYHSHSIIPGVGEFEGAVSEGTSDYLAATIVDDAGMGRGFFLSAQPLRDLDPEVDLRFPNDLRGEVHADGEIIGAALWHMREQLIATHGVEQGVPLSDFLYQAGIARAVDMPSMYVEILAADDDDGDLANGTPNECDINAAFGRHGFRPVTSGVTPLGAETPEANGFNVAITFTGFSANCEEDGLDSASIEWNLRSDPGVGGTVDMTDNGPFSLAGAIPIAPEGEVVQYEVNVVFKDARTQRFPANDADPKYEFFVGSVEELYCTDFETDPFAEGWTHELTSGQQSEGADDWQWDAPGGRGGDPSEAFSGARVLGNDLGNDNFNGLYQADKVNAAISPAVDVQNFTNVRLQFWRWLNVEDAQFDKATIYVNDAPVWTNVDTSAGDLHHQDQEWVFKDLDISDHIANGQVQVRYEIASDGGLELGGWTIDDFCIAAYTASVCGDGDVTGIETCDDGTNNKDAADACRTNCQLPACGDGIKDSGEACDDGNDIDDDDCTNTCARPPGFEEDSGDCGCTVGGHDDLPVGGISVLLALGAFITLRIRRRRSTH